MMRVEVNNLEYIDAIQEITLSASLLKASRTFSITVASTDLTDFRLKAGNSIQIFADDVLRFTGFIDMVQRRQSIGSDNFIITGRSTTQDLIDSTIGPEIEFRGQQSLRTVAETLIGFLEGVGAPLPGVPIAIEPFIKVVIDEVIEDFSSSEPLSEEPGQTYFEILEKFARKRSVLVTTNGNGDLVFTRGRGNEASSFKIRNLNESRTNNNVKSMSFKTNISKRFFEYNGRSQPSIGGSNRLSETTPENLILTEGSVIDPNVRQTRKKYFIAENSSSEKDVSDRALWEAIRMQSESFIYEVTVRGHSFNGLVWDSNISVDTLDDYADINGNMLVRDVILKESIDRGEETVLTCIPPNSYSFQNEASRIIDSEIGQRYTNIPQGVF